MTTKASKTCHRIITERISRREDYCSYTQKKKRKKKKKKRKRRNSTRTFWRAWLCFLGCITGTLCLRHDWAQTVFRAANRLVVLVVKASASGAADSGFDSGFRRDFSGSSHASDLKIGTPVATLPGACRDRVRAGSAFCRWCPKLTYGNARRTGEHDRLHRSMCGVTVSMSAFLACHQYYCAGSSLAWGLNLRAVVCGIFWSSSPGVFSGSSGFLPSYIGLMFQPIK